MHARGVLFFSAEDDPADTLRPRLEAVGANLRRVHFINGITVGYSGSGTRSDRAFSLETDVEALDAKLTELGEDFALFETCFPGIETLNGQMLATCNRSAERLARRWNKAIVAGSDAHTLAALGLTYTEVPGAESADAFMDGLKNRAGCARGISGDYWTLTQAVMSIRVSLMRGRAWTVALAPLFLAVPFVILANYAKEHAFNRKWTRRLGGRTILLTPACAPGSAA